jgi:hypothetical protein
MSGSQFNKNLRVVGGFLDLRLYKHVDCFRIGDQTSGTLIRRFPQRRLWLTLQRRLNSFPRNWSSGAIESFVICATRFGYAFGFREILARIS